MDRVLTTLRGFYFDTPKNTRDTVFICLVVVFVGFSSFFLGRLSAYESGKEPIRIVDNSPANEVPTKSPMEVPQKKEDPPISDNAKKLIENSKAPVAATPKPDGYVIGVKSSKKIYLPWCGTVQRLTEKNAVVFNSLAEAKAAGYTPAKNCKGLE